MRRVSSALGLALLMAGCDTAPTSPSGGTSAPVTQAPAPTPAPLTCGRVDPFQMSANLGTDGYVTVHHTAVNVPSLELTFEVRDGDGRYRDTEVRRLTVGDLASSRFRFDRAGIRRVRARGVTACETFGPFTDWVEFTT